MKFTVTEKEKKALCRQVPEFRSCVKSIDLEGFECFGELFPALVQSIVSQQLSVRVADVIYGRVKKLLGEIAAERIASADFEALRACGLSARKIEYLKGIAEAELSGSVDFDSLSHLDDAAVIAQLVKLKGVGVWTAEMLLIFALGRKDVLSYRDLGIRRGIMLLLNRDSLSGEEFEHFRKRCSPHGTLASLYLWKLKDGGLRLS